MPFCLCHFRRFRGSEERSPVSAVECKFVIFAVSSKRPLFGQGTKARFTKKHGLVPPRSVFVFFKVHFSRNFPEIFRTVRDGPDLIFLSNFPGFLGWGDFQIVFSKGKLGSHILGNRRKTVSRVLFQKRELTEFCGLGEFCEKLGEFALAHKS